MPLVVGGLVAHPRAHRGRLTTLSQQIMGIVDVRDWNCAGVVAAELVWEGPWTVAR